MGHLESYPGGEVPPWAAALLDSLAYLDDLGAAAADGRGNLPQRHVPTRAQRREVAAVERQADQAYENSRPPAPQEPAPQTKKEKREARKIKRRRRQQRADVKAAEALQRYADRYKSDLGDKPLAVLKKSTWEQCRTIMAEPRGDAARQWLRWCPNPVFCGYVRMMARIPGEDGEPDHFAWGDLRARQAVALGALLWGQRKSGNRDDQWTTMVEGLTLDVLRAALQDPHTGKVPSEKFLCGTYGYGGRWNHTPFDRGARRGPGCGIVVALEQLGGIYRNQWTGQGYATREGYQPNQYWITCWLPPAAPDRAVERMAVLDYELNCQALDEQGTPVASRWLDSRAPP